MLVCGLSQPAAAWQLGMVPALTAAGYRVVTFDNRGVAPSSSPPAPYTVDEMVDDTVGLLDHLGLATVRDGRLLDGGMDRRDPGLPAPRTGPGRRLHR